MSELAEISPAPTAPSEPEVPQKAATLYMQKTDFLWASLLGCVVVINLWFGIHNHSEAQKAATTKQNAENLLQWLSEKGPIREKGESVLPGCDSQKDLWQDCLAAITAQEGPLHSFRNYLEPGGRIFSDTCDRTDIKTLGSIVVEKGTPKPIDPSAMTYAKMPAKQILGNQLPIRIYVCGRSFHPMSVGETVF